MAHRIGRLDAVSVVLAGAKISAAAGVLLSTDGHADLPETRRLELQGPQVEEREVPLLAIAPQADDAPSVAGDPGAGGDGTDGRVREPRYGAEHDISGRFTS